MDEELIKRLKASCYNCKLWNGYKCRLKGECTAQTMLEAADVIEELSAKYSKALGDLVKQAHIVTNADRIRSMTDEEMADEILGLFAAFYEVEWSKETLLNLLKQEAEEGKQ